MAFLLKFDCNSWRMRRLVLLKFLVVRISGNSVLNEDLEYGRLSGAAVICLLDSVKLIEYIFSPDNECSPNPCVGPFPRIKMYFPLLSRLVEESIFTP